MTALIETFDWSDADEFGGVWLDGRYVITPAQPGELTMAQKARVVSLAHRDVRVVVLDTGRST